AVSDDVLPDVPPARRSRLAAGSGGRGRELELARLDRSAARREPPVSHQASTRAAAPAGSRAIRAGRRTVAGPGNRGDESAGTAVRSARCRPRRAAASCRGDVHSRATLPELYRIGGLGSGGPGGASTRFRLDTNGWAGRRRGLPSLRARGDGLPAVSVEDRRP